MRLLLAAVFTSLVSAIPAKRAQPNIPLDVAIPTSFPPVQDGATPYVTNNADKAKREEAIEGRAAAATLIVDIWEDADRGGRHEGLYTDTQKCYGLFNGWNDRITSLSVPNGYACYFWSDADCQGNRLSVPGGNYIANVGVYGFNDVISSYLCWN
ncbi:uncharacterized protein B0T15DRAFT_494392 [Chaetomium strumarium]|uniref:Uncharacterized protein n=1 Tax=Chaetomium strumarium TaxID=1170767 RepID=A0AAJ0GPW5_9PEZI|nr:hypothetical protein B0T15DRAFT_494392 [Chaetomium strumarium]